MSGDTIQTMTLINAFLTCNISNGKCLKRDTIFLKSEQKINDLEPSLGMTMVQ